VTMRMVGFFIVVILLRMGGGEAAVLKTGVGSVLLRIGHNDPVL
jgi:hypothetical protein